MAGQVKVYTLHLWPPLAHAKHYTGSARDSRVRARLADHALGRGARMLQVQLQRGGKWVVAQVEPGSRMREIQLKQQGGASRRCEVCKAVKGFQAGQLTKEEALARAGWERATSPERSTLLEIFGLEPEAAPCMVPHVEPKPFVPAPRPAPVTEVSPEVDALVDRLIAGWSPKAPESSADDPRPEHEMEMETG